MEFILIRHTRCDIAAGTCYGQLDVPLAKTAAADIERTLAQTPRVRLVFSSPSRRCHELALALAERDACAVRVMSELRELHFGEWEGRRWSEVPRAVSEEWTADTWNRKPPGGESELELSERVKRAAAELLKVSAATELLKVSGDAELPKVSAAAELLKDSGDAESLKVSGDAELPKVSAAAELLEGSAAAELLEASAAAELPKVSAAAELLEVPGEAVASGKEIPGAGRIAVVSHGGPLRLLRCLLTGVPFSERWALSMECGQVVSVARTSPDLTALPGSACRSSDP